MNHNPNLAVWEEHQNIVRKLYRNVSNTAQIRGLIYNAKLPFTLINPKLIVDQFQLSVALTKALFNAKGGTMSTKSLQNEILFCLSPSKHISDSLKIFSTQDHDTSFIVIGEQLMFSKVGEQILGEEVCLEVISQLTDKDRVKKLYQISDEELVNSTLLDSVISKMASKDFVNVSWAAKDKSLKM